MPDRLGWCSDGHHGPHGCPGRIDRPIAYIEGGRVHYADQPRTCACPCHREAAVV